MEIHVDTSKDKDECVGIEEMKVFIERNINVKLEYFVYEVILEEYYKEENVVCLFAKIKENNQTEYDINTGMSVFVYVYNNEAVERVLKKEKDTVRINVDECAFVESKIDSKHAESVIGYIKYLYEVFYAMEKIKFSPHHVILLQMGSQEQNNIIHKILLIMGYRSNNIHNEIDPSALCDLFITHQPFNTAEVYKHLNFNATIISLSSQSDLQLDPRDINYLYTKSISIKFMNLKNSLSFSNIKGREMNFITEILNSLSFN